MDKEQAKRVRQFMRDSGIKHYIYGIGKILSDKWNVEIYVLHIND